MDERIMKVLEAAGARIADLEADLAEMKDANFYVCGQRDALENALSEKKDELKEALSKADSERDSANYWYKEAQRIESDNKLLKREIEARNKEYAAVEAVD